MSLAKLLRDFLFDEDVQRHNRPPRKNSAHRDKHVFVKHRGRQVHYRINKYGELYEK